MTRWLIDAIRGALMGAAEVVPGVSGGTIALIVGIYRTLIDQAAHIISSIVLLVRGGEAGQSRWTAAWQQLRTARWDILVPVGLGMVAALILGAKMLEPLLADYPEQMRAVFSGLVVAGLYVPIRMVAATERGRWRLPDVVIALTAGAVAFVLTGLPAADNPSPSGLLVFFSGAIAISALVLPGVSGSFILLSMGLYETTISAVNDRDLAYLATFAAGALLGLGSFIILLQWLLAHKARITLTIITGLMAGSLRALWPWQTDDRDLLAPHGDDITAVVLLFIAGFALVAGLLYLEKRFRHHLTDEPTEPAESTEGFA